MKRSKVTEFWQWFADNANRFDEENDADDLLIHEIDEWVSQLGDFAWELGPGYNANNMFVLSPGGNREKLEETRAIISEAPVLEGWEFYHSRQPLQGDPVFVLYQGENSFKFDASVWKYVLLRFEDNTFDILIKADNCMELSVEEKGLAMRLGIDGVVGEEERIGLFVEIEMVDEFPAEYKGRETGFPHLLNHLRKIFKDEL